MKPIKLSMTAFGPYRDQEVIDFTDLKNNKIFVISGTTGSGKTTIFDGICYALYGSVSGEERDNAGNVRSDFADDKMHTTIELIFEMKGKRYRILRQLAHVKKGNKTATGEKNEFVEIKEDQEVPVLDSHKIRDMNNKLEEIIGLTQDQFKQIVMLPQGEFQKLLTSDSQNKGEILRKIFKTENFKKMADRLRLKKTEAEKQLESFKNEQQIYIASIHETFPARESALFAVLNREYRSSNQIVEALQIEIEDYTKIGQDMFDAWTKKKDEVEKSREILQIAQQFNKELQAFEEAKVRYLELQQQVDVMQANRQQLLNAEKAQHIIPYENAFRQKRAQLQALTEQIELAKTQLELSEKTYTSTKDQLTVYEQDFPQQEQRKQALNEWQRILPFYEEVTKLENAYEKESKLVAISDQKRTQNDESLKKTKSIIEQQETQRQQLQLQTSDFDTLLKKQLVLEKIENQLEIRRNNEQILLENQEKANELDVQIKQQQLFVSNIESNWLKNQAYVLASQLTDGAPCPVCGSLEHQQLHWDKSEIVSKEQLEQAKQKLTLLEQQSYTIVANRQHAENAILQVNKELQQFNGIVYEEQSNKETILQLNRQIQDKELQKKQLVQIESQLNKVRAQLDAEQLTAELLTKQHNEEQLKYQELRTILTQKRQQLSEQFTTQQQLMDVIQKTTLEIQNFERKLIELQERTEKARQQLIIDNTSLKNKQQQQVDEEQLLQDAQSTFQQQVLSAGFADGKAYTAARIVPEAMLQLKELISAFDKELYAIEQQIVENEQRFNEQQPRDLFGLQNALNDLISEVEQMNEKVSSNRYIVESANRLAKQLKAVQEKMAHLEQRAGHIIKLFDLLSGKNEQKISFERYLQIEYLEQIIHAANERLIPLSNGQYRLLRSERLDGNGKQSGLSLDVYDTYTGQERDVKTLSGGEQFNASLCLALGMSDIIQSFKGNVHMDTMFIDEGFGTLDEEALAKAIDTLVDLQRSGRMIGIISHVSELKDTIPAILEVKKTKEGYSHTRFVLK